MRKLLIVAVIALIGLLPVTQASAQAPVNSQTVAAEKLDVLYPFVLAAGAVTAVIVVNYLTSGGYIGVLPMHVGVTGVGPITDATATALSRVYAVTGAVVGAWIANWLYTGE